MAHSKWKLILAITPLLATACEREEPASSGAKSAPRIQVVEVTPHPIETKRAWPATMEPLRIYEIVAPHDGRITAIHSVPGDHVEAGSPLLAMIFPDANARRAELLSQVAELENELRRVETLGATRAVSESDIASARIRLHESKAEINAIKAILAEGEIKAPSTGIILETNAAPGSSVVQEAILVRIADAASIGLRLDVPNSELRHFSNTDALTVHDENGTSHRIARLIRHGEIAPHATRIELWLDPASSPATGTARVEFQATRDALCIPWSAIAADDGRSWVAAVDADHHIRHREITSGETTGTLVEITGGLAAGDTVVLYQPRSHANGAKITPVTRYSE